MAEREDLKGRVFEKLTVIEFDHVENNGNIRWKCKCECGNETVVAASSLKKGNTKSCGCLRKNPKRKYKEAKKTKQNKGGIYYFQPNEIELKGKYQQADNERRGGKVTQHKLSTAEFDKYMRELKTKEVQYRK